MSVLNQITETQGKLNYTQNVIAKGVLELWEVKEYIQLESVYILELNRLNHIFNSNPLIFA